MHRLRQTKIVATIGPASSSPDVIEQLFISGVDVFRLNFSHGTHEQHQQVYTTIRSIEKKLERPIGILMDLQGPKLRIGSFKGDEVELETGQSFRLDLTVDEPGDRTGVGMPHPEIFAVLEKDKELLLNDGKIRLQVQRCGPDYAETRVLVGGTLSNNKGVNLPGARLPLSVLTPKDRTDLEFGLKLGVDIVGLSFVQRPEDITEARALIGTKARIAAKIEKPSALDSLEEIIELSDAIMIARGDLGVEMPPEDVPLLQRRIIRHSRQLGRPVIVATQMLESMIHSPMPTRAETSDVANAVYGGADAVMLSAESASGDFPREAVTMMDRIIQRVEEDPLYYRELEAYAPTSTPATVTDAIATATRQIAATLSSKAIVTFTLQGKTPLRIARQRPSAPILALTTKIAAARFLALVWGVRPITMEDTVSPSAIDEKAREVVINDGYMSAGESIIITSGANGVPDGTNMLRILKA